MYIEFTIPGIPQGKARPRAIRRGYRTVMFTPEKTRGYEMQVRAESAAAMEARGESVLDKDTNVEVHICAYFEVPKSTTKKNMEHIVSGHLLPTVTPDIDNIVKAVLDGMNGVVYKDDKQIVDICASKRYAIAGAKADAPRVVVAVWDK